MSKYYVEIYTLCPDTLEGGWDIEILELYADSEEDAKIKAKEHPLFDCVLTSGPIFED